jgi:hypothetical protein
MSTKFDALGLATSFFLGSIAAAGLHGQTLDLTTLAEKTRSSVFFTSDPTYFTTTVVQAIGTGP